MGLNSPIWYETLPNLSYNKTQDNCFTKCTAEDGSIINKSVKHLFISVPKTTHMRVFPIQNFKKIRISSPHPPIFLVAPSNSMLLSISSLCWWYQTRSWNPLILILVETLVWCRVRPGISPGSTIFLSVFPGKWQYPCFNSSCIVMSVTLQTRWSCSEKH